MSDRQTEYTKLSAQCDSLRNKAEEAEAHSVESQNKINELQKEYKVLVERFRSTEQLQWQTQDALAKTAEELRGCNVSLKRAKTDKDLERKAKEGAQRQANEAEEQLRTLKRETADVVWQLEAATGKQADLETELEAANQRVSDQIERNNQMVRSQGLGDSQGLPSIYLAELVGSSSRLSP